MIYRTKVDLWLPLVLLLPIVLPFYFGLNILLSGDAPAPLGWFILLISPAVVALLLLFWPLDYDPGATRADGEPILRVRSGRFFRFEIPLARIGEVRPSGNPITSPALSLDRLEVIYPSPSGFRQSLLISPKDRDGFLDELAHRTGHLRREGDRLVQRQESPTVS